jgi:hypothetical protein
MKHLKISTIAFLAVILLLSSCANKKKEKEELQVVKSEIAHIVSNFVYPLPSSFELMEMLNEIEAAYIFGITNPTTDVEKYTRQEKQALNLGIYLSDLSYTSIYRRKQAAQEYLSSCEKLVRALHVDRAFQEGFIANVADNIDDKDTLVSLITDATQNIYSEFHRKDKTDLAHLMVAGAWVESMYLTLIVSENTPLNAQIIKTVIFQHESLLETIILLESSNEKPEVLIAALEGMKNTFSQEDPNALTVEQVKDLSSQVNALRAHLVK